MIHFARFITAFAVVALIARASVAGEPRIWKSSDGKYTIEADFVRADSNSVHLKRTDDSTIVVPIAKLSDEDQEFIRSIGDPVEPAKAGEDEASPKPVALTARQLTAVIMTKRKAIEVYKLCQAFLANDDVPASEKSKIEKQLKTWERLAKKQKIRVGKEWFTEQEAAEAVEEEKRSIAEVRRLIGLNQGEEAREKLAEASRANPASIRSDFELGLVYLFSFRNPGEAEDYFRSCLSRSEFDYDSDDAQLVAERAAIENNLGVAYFRQGKISSAIRYWEMAFSTQPTADPTRHNIKVMQSLMLADETLFNARERKAIEDLARALSEKASDFEYDPSRGVLLSYAIRNPLQLTPGARFSSQQTWFPDTACLGCNGVGKVGCGNSKCSKGTIRVNKTQRVEVIQGSPQTRSIVVKERCPVCRGKGAVACPRCKDAKRDPWFR